MGDGDVGIDSFENYILEVFLEIEYQFPSSVSFASALL